MRKNPSTRESAGRKTSFRVMELVNLFSVLSAELVLAVDHMLSARVSRTV